MAPTTSAEEERYAKLQQDSRSVDTIPVVVAGIDGPERQKIFKQIAEASESWGFFQIINHGVDQSLIKRTKDVSRQFFHGPEAEKMKIKPGSFYNGLYGWKRSDQQDMSEAKGSGLVKEDTVEHLVNLYSPERPDCLEPSPQHPASYKYFHKSSAHFILAA
jgi:isopenicillin N synthase-like dioxygenase